MDEYEVLKFSALLHDIGKFLHRAENREATHEELGKEFCSVNLPKQLQDTVSNNVKLHGDINKALNPSFKELLFKKIVIADWLSAEEREEREIGEKKGKPKLDPIISIFSQISLDAYKNKEWVIVPNILKLSGNIFSTESKTNNFSFSELYKKFEDEFIQITKKFESYNDYFDKVYYLLKKYTIFIPSATYKDIPNISLFDHLKTTCAIASCLHKENVDANYIHEILNALNKNFRGEKLSKIEEEALNTKKFLLISGDIPGIQKFIYTIASKGALKSLKGRSFFLVLLSEVIAKNILRELGLPTTNLLFCGGGHFYILAYRNAEKELEVIRDKISKKLLVFGGKLYLALGYILLSARDFEKGEFSKKWKEVSNETNKFKNKRFIKELKDNYEEIFGPFENGGEKIQCDLCKDESDLLYVTTKEGWQKFEEKYKKEIKYCKVCKSFVELSKYIQNVEDIFDFKEVKKIFKEIGLDIDVESATYGLNITTKLPFKFVPVGVPCDDEGDILNLDELVSHSKGLKKLAVLKMDVDNLGDIFKKGLENRTISRISNLSFLLSLFFEGWLNVIISKDNYKNKIYIVYAGGDDTFIIGPWNLIFELAYDIYRDFKKYTCNNRYITISAGIEIVDPEYPIHKSAELAEEALDKAKHASENPLDKNRICIFGEAFKWDIFEKEENIEKIKEILSKNNYENLNEFAVIWYLKELLVKMLDEKNKIADRSILQKINNSIKGLDKILRQSLKKTIDLPRIWRLRYYLRDLLKKDKEGKYAETITELYEDIVKKNVFYDEEKSKVKNIKVISAAVRWAELLTRKEQEVGENEQLGC